MWHMALSSQRMCNQAASVTTELLGIICRKSESRIGAVKSGNADGAKAATVSGQQDEKQGPDTEPEQP
jgi:hypothetical protein